MTKKIYNSFTETQDVYITIHRALTRRHRGYEMGYLLYLKYGIMSCKTVVASISSIPSENKWDKKHAAYKNKLKKWWIGRARIPTPVSKQEKNTGHMMTLTSATSVALNTNLHIIQTV